MCAGWGSHVIAFVPLIVPFSNLPISLSLQTRMSVRSLEVRCVVPGAVRTPLGRTAASWAASLALREKTPQTAVSGQTTCS